MHLMKTPSLLAMMVGAASARFNIGNHDDHLTEGERSMLAQLRRDISRVAPPRYRGRGGYNDKPPVIHNEVQGISSKGRRGARQRMQERLAEQRALGTRRA